MGTDVSAVNLLELHLGCMNVMTVLVNTSSWTVVDPSQYVLVVNGSYNPMPLHLLMHAVQ